MLQDLTRVCCDGSVKNLLCTLIRTEKVSEEDLLELKRLSEEGPATHYPVERRRTVSPLDLLLGYRQVWMAEMPVWAWLLGKITLLLALAWLIHVALERQNPRWRILLRRGAAVAMIVLGVGTLGLPGLEICLAVPPPVSMQSPPSTPPIVAQHDLSTFPAGDGGVGPHAASRATTTLAPKADADDTAEQTVPTGSVKLEFSWRGILLGIWSIVPVLMAARLAVGYVRIVHLLKHSPVAPDWVAPSGACCRRDELPSKSAGTNFAQFCRAVPLDSAIRSWSCPDGCASQRVACRCRQLPRTRLVHVQLWDFGWNAALQVMSIALWFHPLAWRIGCGTGRRAMRFAMRCRRRSWAMSPATAAPSPRWRWRARYCPRWLAWPWLVLATYAGGLPSSIVRCFLQRCAAERLSVRAYRFVSLCVSGGTAIRFGGTAAHGGFNHRRSYNR